MDSIISVIFYTVVVIISLTTTCIVLSTISPDFSWAVSNFHKLDTVDPFLCLFFAAIMCVLTGIIIFTPVYFFQRLRKMNVAIARGDIHPITRNAFVVITMFIVCILPYDKIYYWWYISFQRSIGCADYIFTHCMFAFTQCLCVLGFAIICYRIYVINFLQINKTTQPQHD